MRARLGRLQEARRFIGRPRLDFVRLVGWQRYETRYVSAYQLFPLGIRQLGAQDLAHYVGTSYRGAVLQLLIEERLDNWY